MTTETTLSAPNRVTDLVELKRRGAAITCKPSFEIVPVDFAHRDNQFQAFVFLCRYKGTAEGQSYMFRKCYARGCPHNLCPHVSQAVMIANRYLLRDYQRLQEAGVAVEKKLFSLSDMVVKFEKMKDDRGPFLVIQDYIEMARQGHETVVNPKLEFVPGVEHFANYENAQVFLMVDFAVFCQRRTSHVERCLACYTAAKEKEERPAKTEIANERLKLLYNEFDQASITYEKRFFV